MAPVVTMRQLLEAGVHFGHQTRRWNPKMKRFIYGDRNGIYIIDLQQTLGRIETAYSFVRDLVGGGGTVLFVGTKKQAQDPVQSFAERCGMPYVNERWLGGMLTNFQTMSKRVSKMKDYQRMRAAGEFEAMPKKEALLLSRELDKLERNLGGIRNMERLPDAVFVLDTNKEDIAVTEANKLGIPIVAVVDTNCDPDIVQYVIPGNDDAIRSATLMARIISDAVQEGRFIASRNGGAAAGPPAERTAEEEAAIAEEQAEARRQAAQAAAEREARIAAEQQSQVDTAAAAEPVPEPAEPGLTADDAGAVLADAAASSGTNDAPNPPTQE
jgi:small subunit ribosomal protein S2